ncbi:MAG TPA: hypothetical protein VIT67_17920 [Povalibacter sp.]
MNKIVIAVALSVLSFPAMSDPSLTNGAVVRIQAGSIEGGWHGGRLQLDAQKCWMVKLDKPTRDQYTMLSLLVVDQLQLSSAGSWTPVNVKPVLHNSPAVCREYGAD